MISHLGAMISVVNGALMARRFRGISGTVGATCLGEGGTSTGAFHEALNQAAVEKLPLIIVVADNGYAYSTPTARQFACPSLVERAAGYGVAGRSADGTDLGDCLRTLGAAVEAARRGEGPQLVVAKLLRLCGHGEHDDAQYVDAKLRNSHLGRDCLVVARERVRAEGWADEQALEAWREEAAAEVEEAFALVQREPAPDPFSENWRALASRQFAEGNQDAV
jgi:pyruvate dehydrogenase E1 component alpha subunit/2-oxoisovalerate dehydrogenase E1 component alpha subunit